MIVQYDANPQDVRQFVLIQLALTAFFVLLLFWILGGLDADPPPAWHWVVLIASVAVAAVAADRVWLGAEPLDPNEPDAETAAVGEYAGQTVRKLLICEAPILLSVLWAFLAGYAAWPLAIAGIPAVAVLAFELWPSSRNLSLSENVLDSNGADSRLMESFES